MNKDDDDNLNSPDFKWSDFTPQEQSAAVEAFRLLRKWKNEVTKASSASVSQDDANTSVETQRDGFEPEINSRTKK